MDNQLSGPFAICMVWTKRSSRSWAAASLSSRAPLDRPRVSETRYIKARLDCADARENERIAADERAARVAAAARLIAGARRGRARPSARAVCCASHGRDRLWDDRGKWDCGEPRPRVCEHDSAIVVTLAVDVASRLAELACAEYRRRIKAGLDTE